MQALHAHTCLDAPRGRAGQGPSNSIETERLDAEWGRFLDELCLAAGLPPRPTCQSCFHNSSSSSSGRGVVKHTVTTPACCECGGGGRESPISPVMSDQFWRRGGNTYGLSVHSSVTGSPVKPTGLRQHVAVSVGVRMSRGMTTYSTVSVNHL